MALAGSDVPSLNSVKSFQAHVSMACGFLQNASIARKNCLHLLDHWEFEVELFPTIVTVLFYLHRVETSPCPVLPLPLRPFTHARSHQPPARTTNRSGSGPLSRSRERKAASTTDVYGRRPNDTGGVGGEEKGPGSRHVGVWGAGGDGFRLNLERAITTRMQEQLQVHRWDGNGQAA